MRRQIGSLAAQASISGAALSGRVKESFSVGSPEHLSKRRTSPIDPDPIRVWDPAPVRGCRAHRKRRCNFDPAVLLFRDHTDLAGQLRQIPVLTENEGDIV